MLIQMQKDMLAAAAKVAGRVQDIFNMALFMGDEDTLDYIVDNYTEQLDATTIGALKQAGIIQTQ